MRYLPVLLVLAACSSSGTSPTVDARPVDAGVVDAGRPDPLRQPDGGCPACERDGICQPGTAVDACGSSGACEDCSTRNPCGVFACEADAGNRCEFSGTYTPYGTPCADGYCANDGTVGQGFCAPCGHAGEACCPSFPGRSACADGGGLTCSSGTCQ